MSESLTLPTAEIPLEDRSLYFNRELSWLDFNDRVLQLAEDETVPLLERVKFCAIYGSNLDEFVMVRVAGLQEKVEAGEEDPGPDGLTPSQTLTQLREKMLVQGARLTDLFEGVLRPRLAEQGIRLARVPELDAEQHSQLSDRFQSQIFPALTPLAVGPGRPFPYISNRSLTLAVLLRDPESGFEAFARVKVPKEVLPRFLEIAPNTFIPLEEVIARHLDALFPGMQILHSS